MYLFTKTGGEKLEKNLISLVLIAAVAGLAVGATRSWFSDDEVLGDNTFATGDVYLGDFTHTGITVTNLKPGEWSDWKYIKVPYAGTLAADIYAGVGGCLSPGDKDYIADVLKVQIKRHPSDDPVYLGYANELSVLPWLKTETNVSAGDYWYKMRFMLDLSNMQEGKDANNYQGLENTDTAIIIHTVETGGGAPDIDPFLYLFGIDGYDQLTYCEGY